MRVFRLFGYEIELRRETEEEAKERKRHEALQKLLSDAAERVTKRMREGSDEV